MPALVVPFDDALALLAWAIWNDRAIDPALQLDDVVVVGSFDLVATDLIETRHRSQDPLLEARNPCGHPICVRGTTAVTPRLHIVRNLALQPFTKGLDLP